MKVLFSSNKNPYFETFTEYIEKALRENGCQTVFFENRDFVLPGRIRDRIAYLQRWDLRRLNKRLFDIARDYEPDLFLEAGGWNILPDAINEMKKLGIKTALWTVDAPRIFESIIKSASYYDYVFTQGSEAYEILEQCNIKNLFWMPFACDPDIHKPVAVSDDERKRYGCEVCFVGSGGVEFYANRKKLLENLVDFNLGIWGPGWETLPSSSPLKKFVRAGHTRPDEWIKIYSASKIVLCIHYHDPSGKIPCYQASPRVYETLACGAFLIVDGQRDLFQLFKPGEDLVVFRDEKELRMMVKYYLEHPEESKRIAAKGREKVLESHTYRERVKTILRIIRENPS
jgi:spore maturation protein CgeB